MVLTEDQFVRIAANKRAAEQRRLKKAQETIICQKCASADVLPMYRDVFDERICRGCAASDDDWELLNKSSVASEYLLSEDTIRHLRHSVKDNPHRKGWAEMKLYLRRHARIESQRRWGRDAALSTEKARRESQKLERELSRAVASASGDASNDTRSDTEHNRFEHSTSSCILSQMLQQGDVLGASFPRDILQIKEQQNESPLRPTKRAKTQQAYPVYRDDKQLDPGSEKSKPDIKKHSTVKASKLAGMLSAIRGNGK